MEKIDISGTARDFADKFGTDAARHATEQLKAVMARRDVNGAAVWTQIIGAINVLQRRHPRRN